jgi:hypothetical protein
MTQLTMRSHPNVVAVALANKLARMAWAVLAKGESYRPPYWWMLPQPDWAVDDAWLKPGLEIADAIPTSTPPATTEFMIFCQVCWRTIEMTQWSNPALSKPAVANSLQRLTT